MKLSTRSDIEALAKFKGRDDLVTSFYLDADKSRQTRNEIQIAMKNMLNGAEDQLKVLDAAKEKKDSLERDLDLISMHGTKVLTNGTTPGLALFSCARQNFWMPFELPHGPRNRIVFDSTFYVRPLDAILDKYKRICVLLVSRRQAKWYDIYLEEIKLLNEITSDVPARVREGGYEGNEAKRIERHIDAHVSEHFKKAAQITFDYFKKQPFDWLFLSCEENHHHIDSFLHSYLKDRVKARLKARVTDAPAKVLKEVLEVEAALKKTEEEETVDRFIAELSRGGRAVSGLKETLRAVNLFEAMSLVVSHNFAKQGRICPLHKYLYVDDLKCPVCDKKTEIVQDVVDEAIETVLKRGNPVKHITPPSKLDNYGQIGAFLKYKV